MKSEQIKKITEKATEQLTAALNAGHSEALTNYLKAIGRFHRYSLLCVPQHSRLNVYYPAMLIRVKKTRWDASVSDLELT